MWTPKLEKYTRPDGTEQKIGWVIVNDAGEPHTVQGAAVTGFTREEMQALADELNSGAGEGEP